MKVELFGLNKDKSYKTWSVCVKDGLNGDAYLIISSGKEGGKQVEKSEYFGYGSGKQGRSALEQAINEANSRVKKNIDKGYRCTKEELNDLPVLAMLAKDHTKVGKESDIEKGVFTSDKLDGLRLLAFCKLVDGVKKVILKSRTGQDQTLPHIEAQLLQIMNVGDIYDGEAYLHGPVLQDINSAVQRTDTQAKIDEAQRKYEKAVGDEKIQKAYAELQNALMIHDLRPRLEYHVFDVIIGGNLNIQFLNRLACLREEGAKFSQVTHIKEVTYKYANSLAQLTEQLKDCISRGYEGIMYRLPEGVYESGKRSSYLFKFKLFFDEEFMITSTHKDKQGYVVFELVNNLNEETFDCVMGDYAWRTAVADEDFSGQWMTVKFQARNKGTLIPQFGTGKAIRQGTVVEGVFIPSL